MFLRWYWFFEVGVYVVLRGFGKLVGVSTEDRENNMVVNRLGSIGCENVRKVPSSERTKVAKGLSANEPGRETFRRPDREDSEPNIRHLV